MSEQIKLKAKILRAFCRCSGCQENGWIYTLDDEDDLTSWCKSVEVVGDCQLWCRIVKMVRKNYHVVEDDSGVSKGGEDDEAD